MAIQEFKWSAASMQHLPQRGEKPRRTDAQPLLKRQKGALHRCSVRVPKANNHGAPVQRPNLSRQKPWCTVAVGQFTS
jgi:hypothetical protein